MNDFESQFENVINTIKNHETKMAKSFSLVPSENSLSRSARIPYLSDAYSRYLFDETELGGQWGFAGGDIIANIVGTTLDPLLKELGKANHINLHTLSGLSCMTSVLAAFGGEPGSVIGSIPLRCGGHPDTRFAGGKLGFRMERVPFSDWATFDTDGLKKFVIEMRPSLIYLDHSTVTIPIDLRKFVETVREVQSRPCHIHADTSHLNGLIWAGVLPNPLDCGADSYGGSTHKTFPGPHKGVVLMREATLARKLLDVTMNMISHQHTASTCSLALALLEFKYFGGERYAAQVVRNAQAFGLALHKAGFDVQVADRGYTQTHQVWIGNVEGMSNFDAAALLYNAGIIVNPFGLIPSLSGPGIRMGVNEATKLGMMEHDMTHLAKIFADLLIHNLPAEEVASATAIFRNQFRDSFTAPSGLVSKAWSDIEARTTNR